MMGVFVQVNEGSRKAESHPIGYVIQESGCWEWVGNNCQGYGWWRGRGAHRVIYEQHKGPIPKGLYLDHRCRNRACVNPAHLDPVTPLENNLRAVGKTVHWKYRHQAELIGRLIAPLSGWKDEAAGIPVSFSECREILEARGLDLETLLLAEPV